MTAMTWNAPGTRKFQAGCDRGVLFLQSGLGVPWNGLISVNQEPVGGEITGYYQDGVRYANESSPEEFAATVKAYTYPEEFEPYDGIREIIQGVYATQQVRRPFGMSYRTKLGNDIRGLDYGYKIHFVYNATAVPSGQEFATLDADPEAEDLSWRLETVPLLYSGFRPIAHIEVDSTRTTPQRMAALEEFVYGSSSWEPTMPTPADLLELFQAETLIEVVDNGDGTFSVTGPEEVVGLLNPTTFEVTSPETIMLDDVTYRLKSS